MAERLNVSLILDSQGYVRGIKQAAGATDKFTRTTDSAFGKMSGSVGKLGAAIGGAFAVGALTDFAMSAISAASDLEESINAVNVVFGESAGRIHEFGETAADSVGLAQSAFNQLATPLGAMLQNAGFAADEAAQKTIELTQRAADMASVFDTDVSQALGAIQAAFRGEIDPIERFGVSMNAAAVEAKALELGLAETKGEIDATDKAAARLALIMEQTEAVAGDFANTSDSLANQQRSLAANFEDTKAKIGEALMPALQELIGAANDLLPLLELLIPVVTNLVDEFVRWVKPIQLVADVVDAFKGEAKDAAGETLSWWDALKNLNRAGADLNARFLNPFARFMGDADDGIDDAIQGTWELATAMREQLRPAIEDSIDTLGGIEEAARGVSQEAMALAVIDPFIRFGASFDPVLPKLQVFSKRVRETFKLQLEPAFKSLEGLFVELPKAAKRSMEEIVRNMQERVGVMSEFTQNLRTLAAEGFGALAQDLLDAFAGDPLGISQAAEDFTNNFGMAAQANLAALQLEALVAAEFDIDPALERLARELALRDPFLLPTTIDPFIPDPRFTSGADVPPPRSGSGGGTPRFQHGGIVPGPIGAPTLAVLHGGETVIPVGAQTSSTINNHMAVTIHVEGSGVATEDIQTALILSGITDLVDLQRSAL